MPLPHDATVEATLFDVTGKTFLVTGGTAGIGLMIAQGLVEAGARVAISSRKTAAVEEATENLRRLGECVGIPGDVSTPEGARLLAGAVTERFGELNVLVNNAGVTWGAPLEDFPQAGWDRVLSTNVEGVFHLTVALLPALRAAARPDDPARVINVGSIDGLRASRLENYSYSASKAAVHTMTRQLARHLAREAITVNAIAPGPFESRMLTAYLGDDPALREAALDEVPLRRFGTAEDAAGIITFLSSRAGAFITGAVIPIDGGLSGCS
jgi:NAD(P)-dependent dehydrogenase (short-subunit alcohol dehydrogenase family)